MIDEIKQIGDAELGENLVALAGLNSYSVPIGATGASSIWYDSKKFGKSFQCYELCESLDLISEVEKIIQERELFSEWKDAVLTAIGCSSDEHKKEFWKWLTFDEYVSMPARERAEACLLALQSTETK